MIRKNNKDPLARAGSRQMPRQDKSDDRSLYPAAAQSRDPAGEADPCFFSLLFSCFILPWRMPRSCRRSRSLLFFPRFILACLLSFLFYSTSLFAQTQEIDLSAYECSIYSQDGEDGVLMKIFELLEPRSRFCVECGAYDGITGSNTYLLRREGWGALLLDRTYGFPPLNFQKEFITADNICQIFEKYGVPAEFDLLSLDISYNDFYVWMAISQQYRPSVVVIEYNATISPDQDKVVKYRPFFCGDGTSYFGASILALYNLGKAQGYTLVYAEKTGSNLFFIRSDLLAEKNLNFKNMDDVAKIYRAPIHNHLPDTKHRPYTSSRELIPQ